MWYSIFLYVFNDSEQLNTFVMENTKQEYEVCSTEWSAVEMDDLNDILFTKIFSVLFGVAITLVDMLSCYLLHIKSVVGTETRSY
jgi:hypothetical protein